MSREDYKAIREEQQWNKRIRRKTNMEKVDEMTVELELEVQLITEHHLRIKLESKKLDYFPQSGKATWVGSGKWFRIDDIEKFIREQVKLT